MNKLFGFTMKAFMSCVVGSYRIARWAGVPEWIARILGELTAVFVPWLVFFIVPLLVVLYFSGCAASPHECIPGESRTCTCPGGTVSAQVCSDDGARLSPCACSTTPDGGIDGDMGAGTDLGDDLGGSPSDAGEDSSIDSDVPVDSAVDLGPPVVCSSGYAHVRVTGDAVCVSKGGGAECTASGGVLLEWASVTEQHDWMDFFAATPGLGGGGCVGLSRASLVSTWVWGSGTDASSDIEWMVTPTTGLQAALHFDGLIAVSCPGGGSSWICVVRP